MTLHSNSNTESKSAVTESLKRKDEALKKGGNAPFPHSIGRELLPLLVSEDKKNRDAIVLYVYLLAHVNGDKDNKRYMSAWTSQAKITEDTGIDKNRLKTLSDLLEKHGLIKTEYEYSLNKREKLYYPLYSPVINEDKAEDKKPKEAPQSADINGMTYDDVIDYF